MATITTPEPQTESRARIVLRGIGRQRAAVIIFIIPLAFLVLVPIVRLQARSFSGGFDVYAREFSRETMPETLYATVALAVGSLVIAMVLGTLLAWSATRLPTRLRFLRIFPILPMILPFVASVLGWTFLLSPRPGHLNSLMRRLPWWNHLLEGPVDVYTLPWIVIITGLTMTAFVYLFLNAGFQNINYELVEAAHASGSGGLGVFFKVILPLLRPSLIYGGALALLLGLGQFTAPLLLGRQSGVRVLTTEIFYALFNRQPQDPAAAAAIGSPLLLFGIAVVIAQRYILGNSSRFVTHGGKGFQAATRSSRFAVVMICLYALLSTILPIIALAIVAFSPFWSGNVVPSSFTLDNLRQLFATPALTAAVWNSISISLVAVLISLPIGFIAASVLLRTKGMRTTRTILDLIVALPLGVPTVVLGVGFLFAYTTRPFFLYGTKWVILVVYVTIMLPFTTRMHMSGMAALGDTYVEASRVCGAGLIRTNLRIVLPLLRSVIGGAAALMFVLLTHEFTASLLVRAAQTQVMGTILYDSYLNGNYPLVASIALVMTVVTCTGVAIALRVGGSDVFKSM